MAGVKGRSGPTPKRTEQRMGHRTKAQLAAVEKIPVNAAIVDQPPADPEWHDIAVDWYEALAESGQAIFFEPSDWAAARFVAVVMTRSLGAARFNGQLFGGLWSAMNDLMTTEASRRRLRLELERTPADAGSKDASIIADYRARVIA